jgi:hypothetical protein
VPLTVKPVLAAPGALTTLDGEDADEGITMDPFGMSVLKVTGHPSRLPERAARWVSIHAWPSSAPAATNGAHRIRAERPAKAGRIASGDPSRGRAQ